MTDGIRDDNREAKVQKMALLDKSLDTLYATLDLIQDDKASVRISFL